ncbi:MAG: hypothetical protein HY875_14935 [Chloroflexi bacterium]|nr:hypothetical protein [Chloroflexota bacterium]
MTLRKRSRAFLLVMAFTGIVGTVLAISAACGGDDDDSDGGDGGATATATQPQTGPATITLSSSSPITGQKDRILLVYAAIAGSGPVGQACVTITSDNFTVPATVMLEVPAGQQAPCTGSPKQAVFAKGTYTLTAGVYVGGQQTPGKQSTQTAEVAGTAPVQVKLDGAALSK